MSSIVQTVRGPIEASTLGRTYMHEHIFVLSADAQQNYPGEWGDEETRVADAVRRLGALAAQVRTSARVLRSPCIPIPGRTPRWRSSGCCATRRAWTRAMWCSVTAVTPRTSSI